MQEKVRYILVTIINAIIIAGVIILLTGLYYFMIKAGIPYQDPPMDLWIQYEIDAGIGDALMGIGLKTAIFGSVLRFVLHLVWKNVKGTGAWRFFSR